MSESKESSEQQVTQWNVQRLVMPWPPCFYTKRCICLSEIGPHSFYVTKCCQQPMHRKCFFNLIDEMFTGNQTARKCPFCRTVEFVDEECSRDHLEYLQRVRDRLKSDHMWLLASVDRQAAARNEPQPPV